MLTRRRLMQIFGTSIIGSVLFGGIDTVRAADDPNEIFTARLKELETASGGRLGVTLLEIGTGVQSGQRMDERFPMCSTFKVLASGAILQRVDRGEEDLGRRIYYNETDLVTYSPETQKHVGPVGMTVAELCKAAITLSDNTAGNLLLASIGGPQGLTAFARSLGDDVTRLDRIETELNEALPGDPRDTTTPNAMASDLRALVLGNVLSSKSRTQLVTWLTANTTGGKRIRAGLPIDWTVGDKTGSGSRGTANDVAVIWRQARPPIIMTIYLTGATTSADAQNATIADVARAAVKRLGV